MWQKIREIPGVVWRAIINWPEQAGKFVLNRLKLIPHYWRSLIDKWDSIFHRIGTFWVMGLSALAALAYLVYANPCFWFFLFLLLIVFTISASSIHPAEENSHTPERYPVQAPWNIALTIAFLIPVYLLVVHLDFWVLHWRFISLDALAIPALLFTRQSWPRTWRDNRWIIMPAALIALWWVNSSWIVTYETSQKWEVMGLYPTPLHRDSLHIAYPRQIPFDQPEKNILKIWCDDTVEKNCGNRRVILDSTGGSILFSENTDPLVWKPQLPIQLNPRGKEQSILFMRNPFEQNNQVLLGVQDDGVNKPLGFITFENEAVARARNFWLTLLQGGSVIVTVIGAIFAGLKQWDEQRLRDEKEQQQKELDDILALFSAQYHLGQISAANPKMNNLRDAVTKWDEQFKKRFQEKFETWLEEVVKPFWQEEVKHTGQDDFLSQLEIVWKNIADAENPVLFHIRNRQKIGNPLRLAVYHPPEKYPFQKIFQGCVRTELASLPQDKPFGPRDWGLYVNPFGDWDNPFAYGQAKGQTEDFSMLGLNLLSFPFSQNRFSHQKYYFLNTWDIQAAFYSFCAEFQLGDHIPQARETLFVPVLPESWQDVSSLSSYLLHCLAERWLEILTSIPRVVDELQPPEQERLASLLLWRYRSGAIIKYKIIVAEQAKDNPLVPVSRDFLTHLEQSPLAQMPPEGDDPLKWLALRPRKTLQTMFLCADISPTGMRIPSKVDCLRSITPNYEKQIASAGIYMARFLLAHKTEQKHTISTRFDEPDLVLNWLNSRIKYAKKEGSTTESFSALFYPQVSITDFISHAHGSPGKMVMLAHSALEKHIKEQTTLPSEKQKGEIDPKLLFE